MLAPFEDCRSSPKPRRAKYIYARQTPFKFLHLTFNFMDDTDEVIERHSTTRTSVRIVRTNLNRLGDVWQYEPEFFTKFFPIDEDIRRIFQRSKATHYRGTRWLRIPKNPKAVSNLYTPLNNLINDLLGTFRLEDDGRGTRRRSMNTSKGVEPQRNFPVRPALLLTGSGEYFMSSDQSFCIPYKHYASGISPIEIRLEHQAEETTRDRLAVNMQQLFSYHFNRRYAFGLTISQHTLTVYMFDRSGVLSSPSLDYHAEPEQFCAIITGLASHDGVRLGFDTSIFENAQNTIVRTREVVNNRRSKNVDYFLIALPYHATDLVGRATICFAAKDISSDVRYLIKDYWVSDSESEGKESEASLIAHAYRQGVSKGIPQIHFSEEVHVKESKGRLRLDSVVNNRQDYSGNLKANRVHTRLIMTPFGKPFEQFSNRRELLLAYCDALQAHHNLYKVAGILHRDIKPGNIVINPDGDESNRGILIDFDHAIRVADQSAYSMKRKIGTHLFMSRNALEGIKPQTYLDDLESFYYVLVYISLLYRGPGLLKEDLPPPLDRWILPSALHNKRGFLAIRFKGKVSPWFGKPFQRLVENLHSVFFQIILRWLIAQENEQPPPNVDDTEVYATMLSHVREAIDSVAQEDDVNSVANGAGALADIGEGAVESSTSSGIMTWMKMPRSNKLVLTLAANRARRDKANYRTQSATELRKVHLQPGKGARSKKK
ncbi:hypothetical protein K439DRAFT_825968 [Ramaria rubella]|nr:hypothetical protein K439DRAFT_825968 [Ramaria rubella]